MSEWESGSGWNQDYREQRSFSISTKWVDPAIQSSGFKRPSLLPPLASDLPTAVTKCIEECFPAYDDLYRLRTYFSCVSSQALGEGLPQQACMCEALTSSNLCMSRRHLSIPDMLLLQPSLSSLYTQD